MATMNTFQRVNANGVFKNAEAVAHIRVTGIPLLKLKLFIAQFLLRAAARLLGVSISIDVMVVEEDEL